MRLMKKTTLVLSVLFLMTLACRDTSFSEGLTIDKLKQDSDVFKFFIVLEETENTPLRYLYGDIGNHIHVYKVEKGRSVLDWELTNLGSEIVAMFVKDVEANGSPEIIVATKRGRILAHDATDYDKLGENFIEPFESIQCMTAANIDEDPQDELIFIADNKLNIYDALTRFQEWRSQDDFTASEIKVANIDDDPQLEIILNTGVLIDSRFYRIETYNTGSGPFGRRIRLLDVNGDGFPEIIGETAAGFTLRIYDVYAQRDIW